MNQVLKKAIETSEKLGMPYKVKGVIYKVDTVVPAEPRIVAYITDEVEYTTILDGTDAIGWDKSGERPLKGVKLPRGLKTIGYRAFLGCSKLERICLPKSVDFIATDAFSKCFKLQSINLNHVGYIGTSAFMYCYALKVVRLKNINRVGSYAFVFCKGLETVDLGHCASIGSYAFQNCESLTQITIPYTVERIDAGAFAGCINLQEIKSRMTHPQLGDKLFHRDLHVKVLEINRKMEPLESARLKNMVTKKANIIYK